MYNDSTYLASSILQEYVSTECAQDAEETDVHEIATEEVVMPVKDDVKPAEEVVTPVEDAKPTGAEIADQIAANRVSTQDVDSSAIKSTTESLPYVIDTVGTTNPIADTSSTGTSDNRIRDTSLTTDKSTGGSKQPAGDSDDKPADQSKQSNDRTKGTSRSRSPRKEKHDSDRDNRSPRSGSRDRRDSQRMFPYMNETPALFIIIRCVQVIFALRCNVVVSMGLSLHLV